MMFCHNCGAQFPDGTEFCGNCGTQMNAQPVYQPPYAPSNAQQPYTPGYTPANGQQPYTPGDTPAGQGEMQPAPKKSKLPLIIGIAVAAIAVIILLVVLMGGSNSPEDVVEDFYDAILSGDMDGFKEYIHPDMLDADDREIQELLDLMALIDDAEVNVNGSKCVTDEKEAEVQALLDDYGINEELGDIYTVDTELTATFAGETITESDDVLVAEIGGTYYIVIDSGRSRANPEDVVEEFYDALLSGDLDEALEYVHPDMVDEIDGDAEEIIATIEMLEDGIEIDVLGSELIDDDYEIEDVQDLLDDYDINEKLGDVYEVEIEIAVDFMGMNQTQTSDVIVAEIGGTYYIVDAG